jgi:hypothetical protein
MLSKSPALVLLPMVGLIALLAALRTDDGRWTIDDGRTTPRPKIVYRLSSVVLPLLVWGAICLATAVALWPALWAGPIRAVEQVRVGVVGEAAEPHMQGNFFLGQPDDAPGPLFYPVALALRLTPWTLLGLLLLPIVWRRARELAPARRDLAVLAAFAIVFIIAMSLFPKKFNRYLVPIFPAIDILAAVGLLGVGNWSFGIGRWLGRQPPLANHRSQLAWLLVTAVSIAAIANIGWWYPYEIAAYNQALGGARAGARTFLTGWGEGLEQVAAWLNQQPDITGVRVASTQPWALQPYLRAGAQAIAPGSQLPDRTGYVVIYVRSTQGEIWPPFDQYYGRSVPLHIVQIQGVDYAWIYQAPPEVAQPQPADFGQQIHLRGLALDAPARRGQPLALKLFWEARATPPTDYTVFAHLVGADGRRYAQADLPYPTSSWRAGQYITTELPLMVPPEAPAGIYRVVIGLYDPNTGQRLALGTPQPVDPALDGPEALPLTEIRLP